MQGTSTKTEKVQCRCKSGCTQTQTQTDTDTDADTGTDTDTNTDTHTHTDTETQTQTHTHTDTDTHTHTLILLRVHPQLPTVGHGIWMKPSSTFGNQGSGGQTGLKAHSSLSNFIAVTSIGGGFGWPSPVLVVVMRG